MKKTICGLAVAALTTLSAPGAWAASVDLSTWQAEGSGNWLLSGTGDSVLQTLNTSLPTVFFNGEDSQGFALSGEITVETASDDDFVGFVLGFNAGDGSNAAADYLLIDWKQATQTYGGGVGQVGFAISRVTGGFNFNDFWRHEGVVTELQRGATLGSTGWADNTTYTFDLIFNPNNVQVFVNGVQEIDINGVFENGSFGFYNFSQARVRYAGIEQNASPPIPEPTTAALLGMGVLGAALRRRMTRR